MDHLDQATALKLAEFKSEMAEAMMGWTRLENTARYLIETLAGARGLEGQILTSRMGSVEIENALKALSFQHDERLREHICRFLQGFGAIRSWRNYLAHAIQGVALSDDQAVGYAEELRTSPKHGLQYHQQTVSTDRVTKIVATIKEYEIYLARIISHTLEHKGLPVLTCEALCENTMPATVDDIGRDWISTHRPIFSGHSG